MDEREPGHLATVSDDDQPPWLVTLSRSIGEFIARLESPEHHAGDIERDLRRFADEVAHLEESRVRLRAVEDAIDLGEQDASTETIVTVTAAANEFTRFGVPPTPPG